MAEIAGVDTGGVDKDGVKFCELATLFTVY